MRRALRLTALLLALTSCGGGEADVPSQPRTAREPSTADGPVVATVNGEPITLAELEDVVRATGLSPRDALTRLEEERALAQLAEEAGAGDSAEVRAAMDRAAIQALLATDVEGAVRVESIDSAAIDERYQAIRDRFEQPERRESAHVLAQLPRDASPEAEAQAERFVRRVIAELSSEADPAAAIDRYRAEAVEGRSFQVRVERVPAAPPTGRLAPEYGAALFEIDAPGHLYPEPVRTEFGFHAIVLTRVHEPFSTPTEELAPGIRDQLLVERRRARLDELSMELAERTPVHVDTALFDTLLGRSFDGSGEAATAGAPLGAEPPP